MVDFTAGIARQLLRYDPETGKLFWRLRDRKWFQSDRDYTRWNNRFAGNEALTTLRFFLGYFDNIETAVAARKQAEMKFGFHENHGRLK